MYGEAPSLMWMIIIVSVKRQYLLLQKKGLKSKKTGLQVSGPKWYVYEGIKKKPHSWPSSADLDLRSSGSRAEKNLCVEWKVLELGLHPEPRCLHNDF